MTHLRLLAIASKSVCAWRPLRTDGTLLGPKAQHLAFGTRPVKCPAGQALWVVSYQPCKQVQYCSSGYRYQESATMNTKGTISGSDAAPLPENLYWCHACHLAQALDLSSVKCLITPDEPCAGRKSTVALRLYAYTKDVPAGALAANSCCAPDCHAALKPTCQADVACAHA